MYRRVYVCAQLLSKVHHTNFHTHWSGHCTSLPALGIILALNLHQPAGREVVPCCGFHLPFPSDARG